VPRFKIVKSRHQGGSYAQFLITVSIGSVTHGVWRRHSDFKSLFDKVGQELPLDMTTYANYYSLQIQLINQSNRDGPFKNTLLSWQCVLNRQRWFRCLDKVLLIIFTSFVCADQYWLCLCSGVRLIEMLSSREMHARFALRIILTRPYHWLPRVIRKVTITCHLRTKLGNRSEDFETRMPRINFRSRTYQ
jgi:hypothetical protein